MIPTSTPVLIDSFIHTNTLKGGGINRERVRKMKPEIYSDLIARFWKGVDVRKEKECWPWKRKRDRDGYGIFRIRKKDHRAHRVAHLIETGAWPEAVLHVCDNPGCCNPLHLRSGSLRENVADKVRKDRQAKGSRNGRAKLTEREVNTIRLRYMLRPPLSKEAKAFGVSKRTIRDIWKRRTWAHLKFDLRDFLPQEGTKDSFEEADPE